MSDEIIFLHETLASRDAEIQRLKSINDSMGKQLMDKDGEIENHVNKFLELMKLIERYNSQTGHTGCGNHVYDDIREHLVNTNNYKLK